MNNAMFMKIGSKNWIKVFSTIVSAKNLDFGLELSVNHDIKIFESFALDFSFNKYTNIFMYDR